MQAAVPGVPSRPAFRGLGFVRDRRHEPDLRLSDASATAGPDWVAQAESVHQHRETFGLLAFLASSHYRCRQHRGKQPAPYHLEFLRHPSMVSSACPALKHGGSPMRPARTRQSPSAPHPKTAGLPGTPATS